MLITIDTITEPTSKSFLEKNLKSTKNMFYKDTVRNSQSMSVLCPIKDDVI